MKKVISLILAVLMVMSMSAVAAFAADGTLDDGVYTVPITLLKASKDETSMGNSSIEQTATVTVNDGKVTAEIKYKDMGLDLSAFGYKAEDVAFKASDGNGGFVDGTINKDAKGNPVSAKIELPGQAEIVPVKINAGISMMGEQEARLKLDYAKATKLSDAIPTTDAATSASSSPLSSLFSLISGLFSK